MTDPTTAAYAELQAAYNHFNENLFDGRLPGAIITYSRGKFSGYFAPSRWGHTKDAEIPNTDEIALNPDVIRAQPILEVLQTIAHEMVHQEQQHFGKPSRNGYHNKQWAEWMERIGLMPSDTGQPGGKRTGQKVSDYAIDGGAFQCIAAAWLDAGNGVHWFSLYGDTKKPSKSGQRTKYVCGDCDAKVWGKAELHIRCGDCERDMDPEDTDS